MKNKVIFVTGSSIGIGKEVALLAAREKASVIVSYFKDKKAGEKVLEECKELGSPNPLLVKLNVKDNGNIRDTVKEIISKYQKIDILINNAGVISWEGLRQQSFDDIENQIRTNLEGTIKMTKALLPYIKSTIINVASGAGQEGYADLTTYCATKFGIRGFSQALAKELENITVYAINPGMTATKMTNYRGTSPVRVASIILNAAMHKYEIQSGGDINVWDYFEE